MSSGLPLFRSLSSFERFDEERRFTCPAAFFWSAGVASLSHGLVFDGPFLPAGLEVFFLDEVLLLDDLLLLALLDDLLVEEDFFAFDVFEVEDFDLALELLELFGLVAFGFEVDLLLVVFLAALAFDFGFVLDGAD